MAVAVIADAHLGGPGGAVEPLLEQLAGLPAAGCRRLVLLGDMFQVWVGDPRFETPEIAAFVASLRELRRGGVRVDYIEGNRDFFLAGSVYADAFDALVPEVAFEAGGERFLAVHGDGLDASDRQYRFWRAVSKSALSRAVATHFPAALARRMIHRAERRLADTNFKHKIRVPERAILAYAERRLAEGYDALLLGHYHDPARWRVGAGEVRLLEAWFHRRRIHWFGRGDRGG